MRRALTFVIALTLASCARSGGSSDPEVIPEFLVGEWATLSAEFSGTTLARGGALYLYANGTAVVVGGPPPIGMRGVAAFVADSLRLNVRLIDRGRIRGNIYLRYDPATKLLQTAGATRQTEGTYTRRSPRVPDAVASIASDR